MVKYTPQELTEIQKAQARENIGVVIPGQELFESKFAFRLLAGNISSTGDINTSYTTRLITHGTIYLRAGDKIYSDDSSLIFGLIRYTSDAASSSTWGERVKAVGATPNPLTVPQDGWYIPIVQFTDGRTITKENRVTAARHVYGIRSNLLSIQTGKLSDNYWFWFSSAGSDDAYATGLYVKGLNHYKTRSITIPFFAKKGTVISLPSNNYTFALYYYESGDMRVSTGMVGYYAGPKSIEITYDRWISIGIGNNPESKEFNSLSEAKTVANLVELSYESGSDDDYESPVYDAKDYGCIGNGTANDAPAIQNLLNKIRDNGGGEIYFPPGTYKVNSCLILYSNTTITLDKGATLIRGDNINFMILSNCADSTLAYNGIKNVIIRGGTIDVGTGFTQGSCAAGFIHAQNILIENVEILHNNAGYHMLDICGCKNVKVKDCYLHDPITSQSSAELIQFDGAGSRTQFPSTQLTEGAATFDGTPDINIEVCGCVFELNSYSPAFGNHNAQANKNIDIHDNIISGSAGDRGAVAFAHNNEATVTNKTTQVFIHHNIFEGCNIGFTFSTVGTGKIYVRDNIFKGITTLKKNPDSQVGEFLNNIELE